MIGIKGQEIKFVEEFDDMVDILERISEVRLTAPLYVHVIWDRASLRCFVIDQFNTKSVRPDGKPHPILRARFEQCSTADRLSSASCFYFQTDLVAG